MCHEAGPHRILPDVGPLVCVLLPASQSMVECLALPLPGLADVRATELAFPIGRPFLDRESQVSWRAEEMNVVGHDQVVSGQLGVSGAPIGFEGRLNSLVCHPRNAVFGADREEDDCGLVQGNKDSGGGGSAPG